MISGQIRRQSFVSDDAKQEQLVLHGNVPRTMMWHRSTTEKQASLLMTVLAKPAPVESTCRCPAFFWGSQKYSRVALLSRSNE